MEMSSAWSGFAGREINSGDYARSNAKTFAFFLRKSVQDAWASTEAGRPIHVARDFVRIQHAGERDYTEVPVNLDEHPHLYPRQWEAFQREMEQIPDGTPLVVLFPDQPQIPDNLKHFNVRTVEQLAALEGTGLSNIGAGGQGWQQKARQFLEAARTSAPLRQMEAALEQRDETIKQQAEAIKAMAERLEVLEANTERRGPGRPRKINPEEE